MDFANSGRTFLLSCSELKGRVSAPPHLLRRRCESAISEFWCRNFGASRFFRPRTVVAFFRPLTPLPPYVLLRHFREQRTCQPFPTRKLVALPPWFSSPSSSTRVLPSDPFSSRKTNPIFPIFAAGALGRNRGPAPFDLSVSRYVLFPSYSLCRCNILEALLNCTFSRTGS